MCYIRIGKSPPPHTTLVRIALRAVQHIATTVCDRTQPPRVCVRRCIAADVLYVRSDGESGAGDKLLALLTRLQLDNIVVVVCRYRSPLRRDGSAAATAAIAAATAAASAVFD